MILSNKYNYLTLGIVSVLSFFTVPQSKGSDFHSPRTAALGGGGHAGPMLNDSIFLNPSFASFLPTYSVSGNYTTYSLAKPSTAGGRAYSISIQDGRSEMFQAGAAYTLREDGSFIHVGASKALLQGLGVGLGGKFFFNSSSLKSGNDLLFSTSYIPFNDLQTSIVVDNLLESNAGLTWGLYREAILGLKYNAKGIVLVYADPHYVPTLTKDKFGHEAGLEFVLASDVFLRVGHLKSSNIPYARVRGDGYGLGLGWMAPRISFDYAYSKIKLPYALSAHSFGATMYF